ncbi:MAG TPA: C25 family cysteine peptidase, partial [bacterium]|nr:C25 family cysteine peptidase [bacterium]
MLRGRCAERGEAPRLGDRWVPGFALAVVAVVLAGPGEARSSAARILAESPTEITFTVRTPSYELDTLNTGGLRYTVVRSAGLTPFAREGEPNLPAVPVLLAIPPGSRPRLLGVERLGETTRSGVRVAPLERVVASGEGAERHADYVYAEQDSIYGADRAYPRRTAWLCDRGRLRHQDVVRVMVAPFRYEPVQGRLTVAREVRVRVSFESGPGVREALPVTEAWESIYQDAILNYDQGKAWRVARPARLAAPVEAEDRMRLTIGKTGIYSVAFDSLAALGFPAGISINDLMVWRDIFATGTPDTITSPECAIEVIDADADGVFSSGDAIQFFARDFYDECGRQGNQDLYTDKNVYWLSWGAGEHRRITSRSGWREAASPEKPAAFPDFIHVERDSDFVNFPPQPSGDLAIDPYVWTKQRRITPFDLPGADTAGAGSLLANFVNYYNSDDDYLFKPRSTTISFFVTGRSGIEMSVGAVTATMPSTKLATFDLPAGLLGETGNRFRFESSLPSSNSTPGNVLDWFEIEYQRRYIALDDALIFTNGSATGEIEYEVSGFSASDLEVYDISDPTTPVELALGAGQIVQDGSTYKVAFRDSVAGTRTYIALSAARALQAARSQMALRPPAARDVMADYVVICHPNFTSDIESLLAAKRAQGHTVFVATPEQVYDDFGNGMKSDVAIRRFIKQAYLGGDAQFVLLVGDANIDHRGVMLNLPLPGPPYPSDVDYVPTHSFVRPDGGTYNKETRPSDNWFVTVDSDSDPYPDLYIGRLPVGSSAEARGVVAKILTFEADTSSASWKKRLLLVSDDEYKFARSEADPDCWSGSDTDFMWSSDSVAYISRNLAVAAPDTVKFYLATCLKDDQPDKRCGAAGCCTKTSTTRAYTRAHCTPDLLARLGQGAAIVNYQGHSNRYEFTHEQLIRDDQSYTDIRGLRNADRPFVFIGLGCWMSDFQLRTERMPFIQESIGEKFLLNPDGAACASFSSACSEYIGVNADFDIVLARTLFAHLVGVDPQGKLIPARLLVGEAVTNALVRYGAADYASRYLLFGDPAMVIDLGPPAWSATVDGEPVGEGYVFEGQTFDTLQVVGQIKDEEAIMDIGLATVAGGVTTPLPPGDYSVAALSDTELARSRSYNVALRHVPELGTYTLKFTGRDYSGKTGSLDINFDTGSAAFFKDEASLEEGGMLVLGQTLKVVLTRPFSFTAGDVDARLDGVAASDFPGYALARQDADG